MCQPCNFYGQIDYVFVIKYILGYFYYNILLEGTESMQVLTDIQFVTRPLCHRMWPLCQTNIQTELQTIYGRSTDETNNAGLKRLQTML